MATVSLLLTDVEDAVAATFPLTRGVTVFGRDDDCGVVLDDRHCSRRHLEISRKGDVCVLRDLDSTNGVLLNGQRVVADCQLREGDVIELGRTRLRFQSDRAENEPPATAVLPVIDTGDVPTEVDPRPLRRTTPRPARPQTAVAVAVAAALAVVSAVLCLQPMVRRAPLSRGLVARKTSAAPHAKAVDADLPATDELPYETDSIPHAAPAPARMAAAPPRLPTRAGESSAATTRPTLRQPTPPGPGTLENLLEQVPADPPADASTAAVPRGDDTLAAPWSPTDEPAAPQGDTAAIAAREASSASAPIRPPGPRQATAPAAAAAPPARGGAAERLPVPPDDEVEREMRAIKKTFGDNFSMRADLARLLAKIRSADRHSDNPARTFALLVTAEREAIQAQLYSDAIDCLRLRAETFDLDELPDRIDLLRDASEGAVGPSADVFDLVVEAAVEAVRAERFDVAIKAAHLAESLAEAIEMAARQQVMITQSAAARPRDGLPRDFAAAASAPPGMSDLADAERRVAVAKHLRNRINESKRLRTRYVQACERLSESPHDKSASEIVGKYLCFVKQEWRGGIAALASGRSTALGELASRELALVADESSDPKPAFEVAGEWWTFAERGVRSSSLPPGSSEMIRSHAAEIYERVLGRLTDPVDAALAENRLAAAKASPDSDGEHGEIDAP
jgi:hypothetical protein